MKHPKISPNTPTGDTQPPATPEHVWPLRTRVVAGVATLAVAATGVVYNRPFDAWVRQQSYASEGLDGIPGTGGVGVIARGKPASASFETRVIVPAQSKDKTFTVTSWRNEPADSTPDMGKAKKLRYKFHQIENGGWVIEKVIAVGESSDYITDPDSLGKKEPQTGSPEKDWSNERARAAHRAAEVALGSTPYSKLPVKETTDQDVLTNPELKEFGKIAKTLGYQTAHELTTAVLMGREIRTKALGTVQRYILDEMGVTIKVKASKDTPAQIEYTFMENPGTPPTVIPYYNPYPAAWWGQGAEKIPPKIRKPLPPPRKPGTTGPHGGGAKGPHKTESSALHRIQPPHRMQPLRRIQPGDRNDGGNNGTRGQKNPHPRSARTTRRVEGHANGHGHKK